MIAIPTMRRSAGIALTLALGLLLSACLLSPGRFTSALDLRKDGAFRFSYSGELFVLSLSDFAQKGDKAVFEPQPCERSDGEARECTPAELDRQMRAWQEEQAAAQERKRQEAKDMAAMFGGLDPSDPRAAEELAARLRQQAGWSRVEYKGNGLFEVDYSVTGRLGHDFQFPVIEGLPVGSSFVQMSLRKDGSVRIDAPGYSPAAAGSPLEGFAKMAMMGGDGAGSAKTPKLPQLDGRFTITTDGEILANNTANGANRTAQGQQLEWRITPRSASAPTALVRLAQ